jgi:hypothetical protein
MESELNIWYLDDGTLGGSVDAVVRDIRRIQSLATSHGLYLNTSKCEVISPNNLPLKKFATLPNVVQTSLNDCVLLGSPIGNEACRKNLKEKEMMFDIMSRRLQRLLSHDAFFLLKNCLGVPKLLYTLGSAPCHLYQEEIKRLDTKLSSCPSVPFNISIDDCKWRRACLPVKKGGLGIRSPSQLAPSCYLASYTGSADVREALLPPHLRDVVDPALESAATQWTALTHQPIPNTMTKLSQSMLDDAVTTAAYDYLLSTATNSSETVRLRAVARRHVGCWLNAVPITSIGLKLLPQQIRVAIAHCLGSDVVRPHT